MTLQEIKEAFAALSLEERQELLKWFAATNPSGMSSVRQVDAELERKHREGYLKKPVQKDEFSAFETESRWPDESA